MQQRCTTGARPGLLICGEYWEGRTETYYLRARSYAPATGRFLQRDPHWNTANMIYGDNPQTLSQRQDVLGLTHYTYTPQITAIMQSGNLYVYCMNSPVMYRDSSGNFVITTTMLLIAGGAILFGTIGGLVGNHIANQKGATGWEKAAYITGGVLVGGVGGGALGAVLAPALATATGIGGISVTTAGISTVAVGGTTIAPELQDLFSRTAGHIFSNAHVQSGIMNLGNNQTDIFNKVVNIANQYSSQWMVGSNEIRTVINGIDTTIRFYIQNGQIVSIDAFVGYSERIIGNLIK